MAQKKFLSPEEQKIANAQFWDEAKKIDLIQFAVSQYGYTVVPGDSSSNNDQRNLLPVYGGKYSATLKLYQFNGTKNEAVDVLLVRRNLKGEYFYTNPNNSLDGANIIQFVKNRNGCSFPEVAKIIKNYTGSVDTPIAAPVNIPLVSPMPDRAKEVIRYFNLTQKLTHPEYIMARGISKKTLESPEFKGRILNYNKIDHKTKKEYINIAFPLFSEKGIVGAEVSNNGFKGFLEYSDKLNGLFISNIDKTRPVDLFVLGEANLDLVSYHQIKIAEEVRALDAITLKKSQGLDTSTDEAKLKSYNSLNKVYIGFCGNLGSGQHTHIQKLIDAYKPKAIVTVNDNDTAGYRYDINLVGLLRPSVTDPDKPNTVNQLNAKVDIILKYKCVLSIDFSYPSFEEGQKIADDLKLRFSSLNKPGSDVFTFPSEKPVLGENKGLLQVEFHNANENVKAAFKIIAEKRSLDNFISLDKAKGWAKDGTLITDWNQSLMDEINIKRSDVPKIMQELRFDLTKEIVDIAKIDLNPLTLLDNFSKHFSQGADNKIEGTLKVGLFKETISLELATAQLTAFSSYENAVKSAFNLPSVDFREFTVFKTMLNKDIEHSKEGLRILKTDNTKDNKRLDNVRGELLFNGDSLDEAQYEGMSKEKVILEAKNRNYLKGLGQFNQYTDQKALGQFKDFLSNKSKVDWSEFVMKSNNLRSEDVKRVEIHKSEKVSNEARLNIDKDVVNVSKMDVKEEEVKKQNKNLKL